MSDKKITTNRNVKNGVAVYDINRPQAGNHNVIARKPQAKTIVDVGSPQDMSMMPTVMHNGGILDEMTMNAQSKTQKKG
jgi:hypothetical protein